MSGIDINIRMYKHSHYLFPDDPYPTPIRFLDDLASCDDVDSIVYGEEIKTDPSFLEMAVYTNFEMLIQVFHFCRHENYTSAERMLDIIENLELVKPDNDSEMALLWGARLAVEKSGGRTVYDISYGQENLN